jgi:transposase
MAYDEKFRARAVAYKDSGHSFKELQEAFGITPHSYYQWKNDKEHSGLYVPKKEKRIRERKINPETLKAAVAKKPDACLRELAAQFHCSTTAVHKRLAQLKITCKKRPLPIRKNPQKPEPSIWKT